MAQWKNKNTKEQKLHRGHLHYLIHACVVLDNIVSVYDLRSFTESGQVMMSKQP